MLYLVRHGKAGHRQAKALADSLTAAGVKTLMSSPFLRCVETLQPTADAIGAKIEIDKRLGEGRSGVDVVELLESLPDGVAICSHGDVIPDTIAALQRRGCEITSAPDWRKGSVWVLDRNSEGTIVAASVWPPPDLTS